MNTKNPAYSFMRAVMDLIVGVLAVYRLTELVQREEGPFSVAMNLRARFVNKADPETGWIARGLRCPKCLSFWFGPFVALLLLSPWTRWIVWGLALSGLRVILYDKEVLE